LYKYYVPCENDALIFGQMSKS